MLNDALDDDEVSSSKRKRRMTYRPHSGPSTTRQAARKHTASPELKVTSKVRETRPLSAVQPSAVTSASTAELTGIPNTADEMLLPDLVLEQQDPDTTQAVSTEEEMDAATALLSLGEFRDDTLDEDNANAELMPIGGPNIPLDIAPQPI